MHRAHARPRTVALVVLAVLALAPAIAAADEPRASDGSEILPPDPAARAPVRGVEVRFAMAIPAYVEPLCPDGSDCILGVGFGLGVFVERRLPGGFAIGGGYELDLNSAQAVYEIATLQSLGARARWVLSPERAAHPTLELGLGVVSIGDVFHIQSAGPYVDVAGGGEFELNETLAFTLGLRVRGMGFAPFRTSADGVQRSVSPYVDVVTTIQAGILWLKPRGRRR